MAVKAQRVPQLTPHPRWVERDPDAVWKAVVDTTRAVLSAAGAAAHDVIGIGVTGHGDGLYLVDQHLRPVRNAILSLDSRAEEVMAELATPKNEQRLLDLSGQFPFVSTPGLLLMWMQRNEPGILSEARHALSAKDYVRARMTGVAATDFSEASVSFTDVRTQCYSADVVEILGLSGLRHLLPPVVASCSVAGELTAEAAEALGLAVGTPVAAGAHDVDCAALGTGAHKPGMLSLVAGTYSINQVVTDAPLTSPAWACRNFVTPGQWLAMAVSPASATNLEWFVSRLLDGWTSPGTRDPFDALVEEVRATTAPSEIYYMPYLFGSPTGPLPSATLLGLRGWHSRGDVVRAILEGVAFNHRLHVDALAAAFPIQATRLTGGAAQNPLWAQMFADVLGRVVELPEQGEASALGAALCAGVAVGAYNDLDHAVRSTVRIGRTFVPQPQDSALLVEKYGKFKEMHRQLSPIWQTIDNSHPDRK